MTSPAEQADLDAMKKQVAEEQALAFSTMSMFLTMSDADLKNCGHKTQQDAIYYTVRETVKKTKQLAKDFIRKWPD